MIFTFILTGFLSILTSFFDLLPSLPEVPEQVVNGGDWFIANAAGAISVIKMFVGSAFFNVIIVVLLAYLAFEQIYAITMWAIKKIPFINVK